MIFEVGDIIEIVEGDGCTKPGMLGRVVDTHDFAVDLGPLFDGHRLEDNSLPKNTGWYVDEKEIKFIARPK